MENYLDACKRALQRLAIAQIIRDPLNVSQHIGQPLGAAGHSIVEYPHPLALAHQCPCNM
jgi:hypothetical protein